MRALAPGESRAARTDHGEQNAVAAPIFARSRAGRRALQAYRFGAKFSTPAQALLLALTNGEHRTILEIEGCNATLLAKCVIIATGADYHRLKAEGRQTFEVRVRPHRAGALGRSRGDSAPSAAAPYLR